MVISSKDNETIKKLKKLKDKKYRDQENCYIIEGIKLIKEAIQENAKIKLIIICDDCKQENNIEEDIKYEIAKYECIYVTEKIFLSITNVINPQGMLAVIEKKKQDSEINYEDDLFLILDDIQDPGNMGTILRTADSLNLKQIIMSKECADIYNPKVVRSTMGAIFRIKIIQSDNLVKTLKEMKKHKIKIITTSLQTNKKIYDIEYNKTAIVIGNEANGVSKEILEIADEKVKIPMPGKTESLNASVATAVILYEAMRNKLK
ncbi:MAG: TrmH family RNA methyltransferase [Clostridia bacterium]|nr:RNA methyltransferase [Clostridia bacterium]